jgi:hypothetical protein
MGNPQKSWKGAPTTNLMSSSAIDASVLGSYPLLEVLRVVDADSPSGFAMQLRVTSTSINSASRATMGAATSIPTSGTTFVSVIAKSIGSTNTIRPSVYTGGGWFVLLPLDGGSIYLTDQYRRFGVLCSMSTASGGPTPAFSMTNAGPTSDTVTVTRWHSPQCEINSFATPFVNGTRSNTQAILDLTNNNTVTANSLTYASDGTFSFNGSSNFISIANSSTIRPSTELTVECIIKPTTTPTSWSQLIGYGQADYPNGNYLLFLETASTLCRALARVNNTEYRCNTSYTAPVNQFTYITFTMKTGDAIRSYFNGVANITSALPAGTFTYNGTTSAYQIGSPGGSWFPGEIPSMKVYNRALTAAEVQQNFNALRGRYGL